MTEQATLLHLYRTGLGRCYVLFLYTPQPLFIHRPLFAKANARVPWFSLDLLYNQERREIKNNCGKPKRNACMQEELIMKKRCQIAMHNSWDGWDECEKEHD